MTTASDLIALDRVAYLEGTIDEIRGYALAAAGANSWSAVERFARQEHDLVTEAQALRDAEAAPVVIDPEVALASHILPSIATWPRPYVERLFKACAMRLGIRLDVLIEAEAA